MSFFTRSFAEYFYWESLNRNQEVVLTINRVQENIIKITNIKKEKNIFKSLLNGSLWFHCFHLMKFIADIPDICM